MELLTRHRYLRDLPVNLKLFQLLLYSLTPHVTQSSRIQLDDTDPFSRNPGPRYPSPTSG
jgi:hypothetical protein